ncbi:UDP-glucose 4-epimerase [subsurface metagenome]
MTEKVLITGGAGFIGSNLIRHLSNKPHNYVILDSKENIDHIEEFIDTETYIQGDIRNDSLLRRILKEKKIRGVIHLAAISRVILGEENPVLCKSVNIEGTRTILNEVSNSSYKPWFIFASSREVYGNSIILPVRETFPLNPINTYGDAKVIGEQLVKEYSLKKNVSSIILRFSNTYGNEMDIFDRVIPKFIIKALSGENLVLYDSEKIFDFTHISDTIDAIVSSIEYLNSNSDCLRIFNVSFGEGNTLFEIASLITKKLKASSKIINEVSQDFEVKKYIGDISLAKEILKFNPKIPITEGIPMTIKRLREEIKD